jgi:glycerol-3-phosphate dehydrogenase (NAD(P)+)
VISQPPVFPRCVAILGGGTWGTALAQTLSHQGLEVRLWVRTAERAAEIDHVRRNLRYLPEIELDAGITVTHDLALTCAGAGMVLVAVPTNGLREIAAQARSHLEPGAAVISTAKGFETAGMLTMSAVLLETLGEDRRARIMALSGPNIALEVARGLPAAAVVAGFEPGAAEVARDVLSGSQFRVYSSPDLVGVEYGGALKNVIAIAAGVCDGLGVGDNGKVAIVTRGLAEIARLGVAAGARPLTFAGLTGLGDCMVTCTSPHSRNRRLGEALARGQSLEEVVASTPTIAEGVNATRATLRLASRYGVEMPIAAEIHAILFEAKPIAAAMTDLLSRGAVDELRGLGLSGL